MVKNKKKIQNLLLRLILNLILVCSFTLLISCTGRNKRLTELRVDNSEMEATNFPNYFANWFNNKNEQYTVLDRDALVQRHTFYDADSGLDSDVREVNVIVSTPAHSDFYYKLDMLSGLIYKSHKYCVQSDVWSRYEEQIHRPPYTEGFIPKVLDKLGETQKVLIFGNDSYYAEKLSLNTRRVRVIGGIVEQFCEVGHCTGSRSWQSHMVLLAVDKDDSDYKDITTVAQLKAQIDWPYFRAFRENGNGRNIVANKSYAAYRMGGIVRARAALRYIQNQKKKFTSKNLDKMKYSCQALYDFVWNHIGDLNSKKNLKLSKKAVNDLRKKLKVLKADFKKEKKEYRKHKKYDFVQNFTSFLTHFSGQYQVCSDYVKVSNVHKGYKKHWFFSYFTSVMKLYQLGYYYSCDAMAWYVNPIDHNGAYVNDPVQHLQGCTNRALNKAFSFSIPFMSNIRLSGRKYFKYIDYDNGIGGTHQKIYSWVPVTSKRLACDTDILKGSLFSKKDELKAQINKIFPKGILWKDL
ncbi:MAG: hypothetical protein ACI9QD_000597 [Thermoproteota archaeon]|jgi:hypothetical protein